MSTLAARRFQVWIDAVGGFLVCQGDQLTLGQAAPGSEVDVPILADLSRQHASIHRDAEGCVLTPQQPVRVNGRSTQTPCSLNDNDLIELGGVTLRYRRPHPLSATVRLEFVSRHRTFPACDAVLLMADACVLGPRPTAHIVCPDWPQDVMLFAGKQGLQVRSSGPLEVDGRTIRGATPLGANSHVTGESFAFSVEPCQK